MQRAIPYASPQPPRAEPRILVQRREFRSLLQQLPPPPATLVDADLNAASKIGLQQTLLSSGDHERTTTCRVPLQREVPRPRFISGQRASRLFWALCHGQSFLSERHPRARSSSPHRVTLHLSPCCGLMAETPRDGVSVGAKPRHIRWQQ
ncbi:hypothetical protein LX36DRAFT_74193 [Colletotrichum falcatum]|nr:hypothetical protein LX36DRAFT_74193 [Colletotrichum falcatum]